MRDGLEHEAQAERALWLDRYGNGEVTTMANDAMLEDVVKEMDCTNCGEPLWTHTRDEKRACLAPRFVAKEDPDEIAAEAERAHERALAAALEREAEAWSS
jgi:hypothetical protein